MNVSEPATMLTDYVLGGLCLYFGVRLRRAALDTQQTAIVLWAGGFLALSVASFAGGTYHGFDQFVGPWSAAAVWKVTVYSIGLASFLLAWGALRASVEKTVAKLLLGLLFVESGAYFAWMFFHEDFVYVILHYGTGLALVFVLQSYAVWARGEASGGWIASGVLVSFAGAAVQQSGLRLHEHFNHNDLYHVIEMASAYLLYRGGLLLRDYASPM